MAINWLKNKPPRWAGKIRAGSRDEKTKKLNNTPHFLLHDVPELIPALGENPTEIYFTVYHDDPDVYFPRDLRWYSASDIVCASQHDHIDPATGKSMGDVAAFFNNKVEVEGLTSKPFPGIPRARVRRCSQACPDLVSGNCTEHFFLRMMIPQHSMGAIYVLDNTSFKGMMNLQTAFDLASYRLDGKVSGQIFRLFKKKEDGHYTKDNGDRGKTEVNVVAVEFVKFEDYEKKFKDKIDPIDWAKLVSANKRSIPLEAPALPPPDDVVMIEAQVVQSAAPQALPPAASDPYSEEAVEARAEDPSVAKHFAEIAMLLGKENAKALRLATAGDKRIPPTVEGLQTYLQGRIKEVKKTRKAASTKDPVQAPAPKVEASVDRPLF